MKKTLAIASALVAAASVGHAQSIWSNTIVATDPSTSNPFTTGQTVDSHLTVTGIGRGAGIGGNAGADRYNASGWNVGTQALAVSGNKYFTWTMTPAANYSINLDSIVINNQASGTGAGQWAFQSSIGGFSATGGIASKTSGAQGTAGNVGTINNATLGSSFDAVTSSLEFRLYAWAGSATAGTYSVNDFAFNGAVTLRAASTLTWDGGQGNGNWNSYTGTAANQSNWNLNNIPASGLADSLTFAGSTQTTTSNNIASLAVNNITFASGAGAFTNSGNAVTLNGGITNSSSNTQTISHGLTLSATSHTVSAASGNVVISGNIIGSGSLAKTGANALTLTGSGNTYSGGTTITTGILNANSASALGTGAVLINGGSLVSSGNLTGLGDLTLSSGSLAIGGSVAATFSLASNADFSMSSGIWTMNLGTSFDSINGSAGGSFTITGGELALVFGAGFDYDNSYQVFNGFGSGSVSGLSITGYDTGLYTANLSDAGTLSFVSTAVVPEPHEYAIATAMLLVAVMVMRRRQRTA